MLASTGAPASLLVHAGTLLGPAGIERERTILVRDGRIAGIGSADDFASVQVDERLGGPTTFVMPGLVNAHHHGGPHGWASLGATDGPLEPWMVEILAAPGVDPYPATRSVAAQQIRAGTTTTLHHHTSATSTPEDYDAEIRALLDGYCDAGLRVVFAADFKDRGEPAHFADAFYAFLPAELAERAAALRVHLPPAPALLEVLAGINADIGAGRYGDATLMLGPQGPVWCTDDLMRLLVKVAADEGMGMTAHVLESPYEKVFGPRAYAGAGTIEALDQLGVLTPGFLISHGCQLTGADAELLAERGTSVVSNPGSNLRLHNGVAPVTMLLEAGVNVALGTDSMSLGDRDDLLDELRLMQALQRPPGARQRGITPASLLRIATEHGARAVGRPDVGAIAVGGSADLLLVDLTPISAPGATSDPVAVVVQGAHPEHYSAVVSQGRVVARHGVVADPPPAALRRPKDLVRSALVDDLMPFVVDYYADIELPI